MRPVSGDQPAGGVDLIPADDAVDDARLCRQLVEGACEFAADEIRAAQRAAASVTVSDDVLGYVVDLAQATRRSPSVQLGVSPRAATALLAASKAWAWLGG